MLSDSSRKLGKVLIALIVSVALISPGSAAADDRDPPVSAGRGVRSGVDPAPGSSSVRPGAPITFNLSSIQDLDAADRRLISQGRYSCLVYECQTGVRGRMFTIEPGSGCDYDSRLGTVVVSIPQQLSFAEYFVVLSTSSYRPRIFPIDPDGQRVVSSVKGGVTRIFGLGEIPPVKSVSHTLSPCDRLILYDRPKESPVFRYYPALPASTVFETGAEGGVLSAVRIEAQPHFAPGSEGEVRVIAVDAYDRPVPCAVSVAMRDPADPTSPVHISWISSTTGELRFGLAEPSERRVDLNITASQGDRSCRASRSIEFMLREALLW